MDTTKGAVEGETKRSTSSRREFLRMAGTGLAGAFAAAALGCVSFETRDGKKVRVWKTSSGAIVHDASRCVGCRRCETACTVRNDGKASAYISRIKVSRNLNYGVAGVSASYAKADGQLGNFRIVGETCRQCSHPACGDACPVGAISADKKTGARVVNADKCVGCGACQRACPWHIATVDPETDTSTKCLLCGGDPSCVKSCPTGAIKFYPWAEAEALLFGPDATSGASADAVSGATA
jgi:Fe-S-cluster-containing dehydrogenase component